MDDLSRQLNQVLSDPQSMSQIQEMIRSLGIGGEGESFQNSPGENSQLPKPAPVSQGGGFDPSMLSGLLGALGGAGAGGGNVPANNTPLGVTPEMLGMVTKLAPLLSRVNQEDDSTRLLRALRPLLSEPRRKKVDEAVKILQMMRLLPLLKESGVFSGLLSGLL